MAGAVADGAVLGLHTQLVPVMSNKQPEALRLADALQGFAQEPWTREEAADELRRLHALNAQMLAALRGCIDEAEHIGTDGWMTGGMHSDEYKAAVAAIAAATSGES